MRERPILFTGEMVRAILEGRKTQTRRVVKPQPTVKRDGRGRMVDDPNSALAPGKQQVYQQDETVYWQSPRYDNGDGVDYLHTTREAAERLMEPCCPYGVPGDRLWVRETWRKSHPPEGRVLYRADESQAAGGPWRSSIHMPRWASRILLEVTDVRVQRVQEISAEDARAEGAWVRRHRRPYPTQAVMAEKRIRSFASLWDSINAKRGFGWHANPWVWAVTFKVVQP